MRREEPSLQMASMVASHIAVWCALVGAVLICLLIAAMGAEPPNAEQLREFLPQGHRLLRPEPVERRQYIAVLLAFPLLSYIAYRFFACWLEHPRRNALRNHALAVAPWVSVAGLAILALCGRLRWEQPEFVVFGSLWTRWANSWVLGQSPGWALMMAVLLVPSAFACSAGGLELRPTVARALWIGLSVWVATILSGLFLLDSFAVFPHFAGSHSFVYNMNAVFDGIVQVYNGKALLINHAHQYGLYPQILEPFFQFIGLSPLKFTLVMAFFNVIALYALYRTLRETTRNPVLTLAGTCLILVTYYNWGRIPDPNAAPPGLDPYYAYYPVRVVFPCLSVYLCWRYFSNPLRWLYYCCWTFVSVGILWNLDSGLVIFLSWGFVLVYDELLRRPWHEAILPSLRHFFVGSGVLLATLSLFSLYMRLRYGVFPDLGSVTQFHQLYYMLGMLMLPMPLFGVWNWVVIPYALGILDAVRCLAHRRRTARGILIAYLSVLGCGLFSYYQGRSVVTGCLTTSYPAIMLATLFVSELVEGGVRGLRFIGPLACLPAGFALLLGAATLDTTLRIPDLLKPGVANLLATLRGQLSGESVSASFLRKHFRPGEEVAILSYASGIYHLESGTKSPFSIFWPQEVGLRADKQMMDSWFATATPPRKVLVAPFMLKRYPLSAYHVEAAGPDEQLLYLTGPYPDSPDPVP